MNEQLRNLVFRTLDYSGFFAGVILSIFLFYAGFRFLLLVFLFYVIAAFSTSFGSGRKGAHRPRRWENVIANGVIPTIGAILGSTPLFFGSITAVAADKLSGEIGLLSSKKPRLITEPHRTVIAGTNGGITLLGEAAAVLTGAIFGIISFFILGGHPFNTYLFAGVAAAFLGANFDSVLGATLENRGHLNKHGVNFLASVFGGLVGLALLR